MLKKIAIIGPESTGKSTLCEQLAQHYGTVWCPEYAREYLGLQGAKYDYDDLLTIAKGQAQLEDKFVQLAMDKGQWTVGQPNPIFIDTEMYVMKVWCEFVFGKCHQYILDQLAARKYHLYLLCNADLPWVHDELREYPDAQTRQRLYQIYKDIMMNQSVPWTDISGDSLQRLEKAIYFIDRLE